LDWKFTERRIAMSNFRKVAAPVALLAAVMTFAGVVVLWGVRLEQRVERLEAQVVAVVADGYYPGAA
jgi:hypothetical protein